MNTIFLFDQIC